MCLGGIVEEWECLVVWWEGVGRQSHTATRDSTWNRREFFAHTLRIWLPDGSWAHICFCDFPLLLISSFATPLPEECKDGLCAPLSPFSFFSSPTPFLFHTQWPAVTGLSRGWNERGTQNQTDSLSTLQPGHLAVSAALGWSLICLVRTIVAQFVYSDQLEVLCVELLFICPVFSIL